MPRQQDPDLRVKKKTLIDAGGEIIEISVQNKTRAKQLESAKKYNDKFETISFRADPGTRDRLSGYLTKMQDQYPDQSQYKSVNAFLRKIVDDIING